MTTMTSNRGVLLTGRIRRLRSSGESLYIQLVRRELDAAGLTHGQSVRVELPDGCSVAGYVKTSGSTPWIGPAGADSNRSITAALRDADLEHGDDCRISVVPGPDGSAAAVQPRARRSALTRRPATGTPARELSPTDRAPQPFPLADRDEVRRLAEVYWSLITSAEREAEEAFERELPALRGRQELDKDTFVRIARWKSVRKTPNYVANAEDSVRAATRAAFRANDDGEALAALTVLDGVAVRTASALLHWMRPERYPLLDFRIVRALGEREPSNWDDPRFYARIAAAVRGHAERLGVDLRTLDRATWTWDKLGGAAAER